MTIFACILVIHYFKKNNLIFYITYLLAGILLPWIKTEGLVYSLFLIIIVFVYELEFNKNKKNYLKYLFSLLIIFSLLIRIGVNSVILDESNLFQSNLENFIKSGFTLNVILTKIYYILFYTINSFFKYPIWLFNIL